MKRRTYNGRRGGSNSLLTVKRLKTDLAEARRERETERKKALLCSMQRDFYGSLVGYFDEYFMVAAKTEEQLKEAKQHYKSFALKKEQRYKEEAKPLIEALYNSEAKRIYANKLCEPYHVFSHERESL